MKALQMLCASCVVGVSIACSSSSTDPDPDSELGINTNNNTDSSPIDNPVDNDNVNAESGDDEPIPFDPSPVGVWSEIRAKLRASPEYLSFEAERLVAGGDPSQLQEFVRNRIRTIPGSRSGFGDERDRRHGARGALRYGEGTLRDKADLLAELLTRSGFEAGIRTIDPPSGLESALDAPAAPVLDLEDADIERWVRQLGGTPSGEGRVDVQDTERAVLASRVLEAMPGNVVAEDYKPRPAAIPIVAFNRPGEPEQLADISTPGIPIGESPSEGSAVLAEPGRALGGDLEITLLAYRSQGESIMLVRGRYAVEDLIGRQLSISTAPAGALSTQLGRSLESINAFVPILGVQGIDVDDALRDELSVQGAVFTRAGDQFETGEDNSISIDDVTLIGSVDPTRANDVATVKVKANGSGFSSVTLRLSVQDGAGEAIDGLAPELFEFQEEGVPIGGYFTQNERRGTRVLLIVDGSSSVAEEFRDSVWIRNIAERVQARIPEAEFRVLVVGDFPFFGGWTADLDEVDKQAGALAGTSDIWNALANADVYQPTVCMLSSDGDATDEKTPALLSRIVRMPPCVFVRAGEPEQDIALSEMAQLVGGTVLPAAEPETVAQSVADFVVANDDVNYVYTYNAPSGGSVERRVEVGVGDTLVESVYVVPSEPVPASRIVGLELVIEQFGSGTVTRMLDGVRPSQDAGNDAEVDLFAQRILALESGSPRSHVVLDEILEDKLGLGTMLVAVDRDGELIEAFERGTRGVRPEVWALMGPWSDPEGSVYSAGYRAVLSEVGITQAGDRRTSVDVLSGPSLLYASRLSDRRAAFEATLRASARLAVVEAAQFQTSAVGLLGNAPLTYLAPNTDVSIALPDVDPTILSAWDALLRRYRDRHTVLPASGEPLAFYSIDPRTGSMIAVLPDGSGGGETLTRLDTQLDGTISLLNWLALAGSPSGVSYGFGVFISLQKALVQQIIRTTVAMVPLEEGAPMGSSLGEAIASIACGAAKGSVRPVLGGAPGGIVDKIVLVDSLIEALTGSAIPCGR